ncbi:MAG: recombinase family protein [Candidatus Nanopelagicales bacterium]
MEAALGLGQQTVAGVDRIYVDHISAGGHPPPRARPAAGQRPPGDTIVIWRLDRLGRSMKHLLDLIEDLEHRTIALVSLNEQIDTTSANGRLNPVSRRALIDSADPVPAPWRSTDPHRRPAAPFVSRTLVGYAPACSASG